MKEEFVKWLEALQRKIEYDEEKTYSKIVIREYRNPNNFGVLKKPDAFAAVKGPCGDTMKISLSIEKERIKNAFFWTDGCGATLACGSMITKLLKGITIRDATDIDTKKLIKSLNGLPKEHLHCSILTVNTLQKAIKNYNSKYKGKRKR